MAGWKIILYSKDFLSGILFLAIGAAAVVFVLHLPIGTAMRMGPAYFPIMLGSILSAIGLSLIFRSAWRPGTPVSRFAFPKILLVLGSTALFGMLLPYLGLGMSVILLVVISAYASEKFRWPAAMALAIGVAVCSCIIFVRLLGLPIPILGIFIKG